MYQFDEHVNRRRVCIIQATFTCYWLDRTGHVFITIFIDDSHDNLLYILQTAALKALDRQFSNDCTLTWLNAAKVIGWNCLTHLSICDRLHTIGLPKSWMSRLSYERKIVILNTLAAPLTSFLFPLELS